MTGPRAFRPGGGPVILRLALLAILAVTSLTPLLLLAVQSFGGKWLFPAVLPASFTVDDWLFVGKGTAMRSAVTSSVVLGVATAATASCIGLFAGRAISRLRGRLRHLAAALAFLPVAVPPLALGTGLQVTLLKLGLGGTMGGVFVAHLVPASAYLSLFYMSAFMMLDGRVEAESRTLGAGTAATWMRVLLPLLRPQILEGVIIGFLISWSQFALTLIVGGGVVRSLPLEVFSFVQAGQDRPAAVGSLILVAPPMIAFAALRWAAQRTEAVIG